MLLRSGCPVRRRNARSPRYADIGRNARSESSGQGEPAEKRRVRIKRETPLTAIHEVPETMKNWNWKPIVAGIALLGVLATFYGTIRADMRGIRTDMRIEMQHVRAEMQGVRAEVQDVRGEIHALRSDVRADIQDLRAEIHVLRSDVREDIQDLRLEMRALHAVEAPPPTKATGENTTPALIPAPPSSALAPESEQKSVALSAAAYEMPCVRSPHRLARVIAAVTLWYYHV